MKTIVKITLYLTAALMTVAVGYGQKRYPHKKRVRVEASKPRIEVQPVDFSNSTNQESVNLTAPTYHQPNASYMDVPSVNIPKGSDKPTTHTTTRTTHVKDHGVENKSPFSRENLLRKDKKRLHKVNKVKNKKRTKGWALIVYLICYGLMVVFLVLMLLALFLWISFTLFLVFLILAIVFGLAATVFLILNKSGVI